MNNTCQTKQVVAVQEEAQFTPQHGLASETASEWPSRGGAPATSNVGHMSQNKHSVSIVLALCLTLPLLLTHSDTSTIAATTV